jgi:hypothetical protein
LKYRADQGDIVYVKNGAPVVCATRGWFGSLESTDACEISFHNDSAGKGFVDLTVE